MRRTTFSSLFFLAFLVALSFPSASSWCTLPKELSDEVLSYQSFVDEVIRTAVQGPYSGKLYTGLTAFIDKFGNRLAGTENLEESIRYLQSEISYSGLKVFREPVEVPYWVRGKESARLLSPRVKDLKILGLGFSTGTSSAGITADVVVVSNLDELIKMQKEIPGKIVLFNSQFTNYSDTIKYRTKGPAAASKFGAVAALVRSVTSFSIYSPHTGSTNYGVEKPIPAASVTLEDADMMARMYAAGLKLTVNLKMEGRLEGNRTSNNLIFDLVGGSLPEQYVTVSGHIDSWDVGQGALDDGVGAFLALHSVLLLKSLNIPPPKRTIRGIMWTGEELGMIGAHAYLAKHKQEIRNWTAALESDGGLYDPLGLGFNGSYKAQCVVQHILSLFGSLNATTLQEKPSVGSDISVFQPLGVPLMEPLHGPNSYIWFHHTEGDSLRSQNSSLIDKNLALFSATSYILANLSIPLPRGQKKPELNTRTSNYPSKRYKNFRK